MNPESLVCKHCNGTGVCQQAIKSVVKVEEFIGTEKSHYQEATGDCHWRSGEPETRWVEYDKAVYRNIDHYYNKCVICGKTGVAKEPDNLKCKVCNGKGYMLTSEITSFFK